MPFIKHKLQEIKEGNLRARCTPCRQTWTSYHVRSACPGCPVYPFEETPSYLKTVTALARERKYAPDESKPDGAYRILKAPYYRLLYDERQAIVKTLTEKQIAANEKRKEATQQKYTCRFCGKYYAGRYERKNFFHGVCNSCQYHIQRYNSQITWARSIIENEFIVLDIHTEPEVQPYTNQPGPMLLIGFTTMDIKSGEIIHQGDMRKREDLREIKHLVCPDYSALVPYPCVLSLYPSALHAVRHELERSAKGVYLFNPNLEELLVSNHFDFILKVGLPVSIYGWRELPWNEGRTARQMLDDVCSLHGVSSEGPTVEVMRRFVLHLAAQQPISIQGESETEHNGTHE